MYFFRKLVLCLSIFAYSISPLAASTNRLAALGGETRLLLDTSNIFLYPASATEIPHLGVDLFDDWGGVVYALGPRRALGLFLNRSTPQLERFNAYLSQNGSAVFRELEARPWIDLVYAMRLRQGLQIGLLGRFAYDIHEQDLAETSASNSDLRLGIRLGQKQGKVLDATFGLVRQRFKDAAPDPLRQTGGNGYSIELRGRWPLARELNFFPSVGFSSESYALAPAHRDYQVLHLGLGLNLVPVRDVLVVAGLLTQYEQTEHRFPGQPDREESTLMLPAAIIAGEVQLGSMLFRLGLRHESVLTSREHLRDARVATTNEFHTTFQTTLGLGLEFGDLLLDGVLERDFLRDGPHIIGGSRHGGGLFSNLSLIYHLKN